MSPRFQRFKVREDFMDISQLPKFHFVDASGNETPGWGTYKNIRHERSVQEYTKDFKKRQKRGDLLPHTAYSRWKFDATYSGDFELYKNGLPHTLIGGYSFYGDQPPDGSLALQSCKSAKEWMLSQLPDPSYWVQGAAAACYSSGTDMLTFLAELNKTRDLVLSAGKRVSDIVHSPDIIRTIKRKSGYAGFRPRSVRDIANNVGGAYLEKRYGWDILLREIEGIAESTAKLETAFYRVAERAGRDYDIPYPGELNTPKPIGVPEPSGQWYTATTSAKYFVGIRGNVAGDFSPAPFRFNVVQTAWELLTFSFIADWLLGVNQAIEASSFLFFADRYTASQSTVGAIKVTTKAHFEPNTDNGWSGTGTRETTWDWYLIDRAPATVQMHPMLTPATNEHGSFSTNQKLDVLAILSGIASKKIKFLRNL
jgi:hypothetical protein